MPNMILFNYFNLHVSSSAFITTTVSSIQLILAPPVVAQSSTQQYIEHPTLICHIVFVTLHLPQCICYNAIITLHFSYCICHILSLSHWFLHIAFIPLHFSCNICHITSVTLHLSDFICHIASVLFFSYLISMLYISQTKILNKIS